MQWLAIKGWEETIEEDQNGSKGSVDLRNLLCFLADQISEAFGTNDLDLIAVFQNLHLDF